MIQALMIAVLLFGVPSFGSETIEVFCQGADKIVWSLTASQTTHGPSIIDDVEYELVVDGKSTKGSSKGDLGTKNGHFKVEGGKFRYVDANRGSAGIVRLTLDKKTYSKGVCDAKVREDVAELECDFVERGYWVENKLSVIKKAKGFELTFKDKTYKGAGVIGDNESRVFFTDIEGGLFVNYIGRPGPGKDTGPWMRDRKFRHTGRLHLEGLDTEVRCRREWN